MQQMRSLCVANIYDVQIGECQIWEENHENGSETGPYGSVRAHIHTGWIPQALGSLWDASRASKQPWKIKKSRFFVFFLNIFHIFLSSLNSNRPAGVVVVVGVAPLNLLQRGIAMFAG